MFKITQLILTASLVLLSHLSFAQTADSPSSVSQFAGPYIGFKLGVNHSSASGTNAHAAHNTVFPGVTAGYNFDVGRAVLGAEAFGDFHHGSVTSKDAGIDLRFGMPFDSLMPFIRLGFTGDDPDTRVHWGLGVEYKLTRRVSAVGEWTADTSRHDGTRRRNDSFTLAAQYHFN